MEKYVFSGALTDEMKRLLENMEGFEPLDMLNTQIDRGVCEKLMKWKEEGFCRFFLLDSGAFSIHTQKAPKVYLPENGGVDYYIDYINENIDRIDVCAQLDTIPGHLHEPKKPEDYIESAKGSWDNYLYMRSKVKNPHKIMPVFHMGEDVKYLKQMLEFEDEHGKLEWCGISPANDADKTSRMSFLTDVYDCIKRSKNPHIKTHCYGFTSLEAMSKFPCTTADSITHRLLAGYCKIITREFGVVSVSDRDRTSKTKSNWSFLRTADEYNLNKLKKECEEMNLTLEQLQESVSARTAFNIRNIQILTKTKYAYKPTNLVRPRKLF